MTAWRRRRRRNGRYRRRDHSREVGEPVRRHAVFSLEERVTDRLREYALGLDRTGLSATLSGLVEAALVEYLDRRCTLDGVPIEGRSPAPVPAFMGRGRPSAASRASRYQAHVERTEGGRRPSS